MHSNKAFQRLLTTILQLLCSAPVICSGQQPSYPDGWVGNYQGWCFIKAQVGSNGSPQCTVGFLDGEGFQAQDTLSGRFVTIVEWDGQSGNLLLLQNVSWVSISKGQPTTSLPVFHRQSVVVQNQAIGFTVPGATPRCVRVEGDGVHFQFGLVVYQADQIQKGYFEEGVFVASNDIGLAAWECPKNMTTLQVSPFCNSQTYNYMCQGTPVLPPSPPSPSSPLPPPFPTPPAPPPPSSLLGVARPTSPAVKSAAMPAVKPAAQSSPTPAPPASHRTAIFAASIGGVGDVVLLTATIAAIISKAGWCTWCSSSAMPKPGGGGDTTLAKDDVSLLVSLFPAPIQGFVTGDPFLRTTAPQYAWIAEDVSSSVYVQAGITDTQLDSMSLDGQPGPCAQLTSAQVHQELELLTSGLLGRGGAAVVFMCRWRKRFGEGLLAIKVLKDAFDTPVTVLQSFEYEGRLLSTIRHPHVVQLYGWCMEPPHVCLIMELLPYSLEGLLYPSAPGDAKPVLGSGLSTAQFTSSQTHGTSSGAAATTSASNRTPVTVSGASGDDSGVMQSPGYSSTTAPATVMITATTANYQQPLLMTLPKPAGHQTSSVSPASSSVSSTGAGTAYYTCAGCAERSTPLRIITDAAPTAVSVLQAAAGSENQVSDRSLGSILNPASPSTPSAIASTPTTISNQSTGTGAVRQKLSMQAVLQVAANVAAALAYLHDRQITDVPDWQKAIEGSADSGSTGDAFSGAVRVAKVVHRDLKPGNVLVNSNGQAKLSDFGLARENQSTTVHTMHINAGTLAYMAPELLALGPTKPTNRVDIYSLGIMMWELVEQRKPWQDVNQAQLVTAVVRGQRPPIPGLLQAASRQHGAASSQARFSSSLPKLAAAPVDWIHAPADFSACPELVDLIRQCWHQREYKRPTAAEVLQTVQAIMEQAPAA